MNSVSIIGNLATNPREQVLPSGTVKSSFLLAVNSFYRDSEGNLQEKSQFFWVEAYGTIAINAIKYLIKGQQVAIEGSLDSGVIQKDDHYLNCTSIRANHIKYLSKHKAAYEPESEPIF